MTVEQYRQMLERHHLTYKVVGDKIRINSKNVPPDIARITRQMKDQLIAADNPILNEKAASDARTASTVGDTRMRQAKDKAVEGWVAKQNRLMNEKVLGLLHGAEKEGGLYGKAASVGEFMYPTSAVGKALELAPAALAALPEMGIAGAAGLGMTMGGVAGAASGEGTLGGAAQGALLPAAEVWSMASPAASKLWKYFTKGKELKKLYNQSLNEVVANTIGKDTAFGKRVLREGANWGKEIQTNGAFQDAVGRLSTVRKAIAERMQAAAQAENEHSIDAFKLKWKGVDKNDESLVSEMLEEKKKLVEQLKERMEGVKSYHEAIDEIAKLNRQAYKGSKAVESASAAAARRQISGLQQHIEETLTKLDPSLADEYKAANQAFSQFMQFRTLAAKDIWDAGKGSVDPQKIQRKVLESIKPLQQGLGNAFGPFFETVGRHADLLKEGQETDLPGALERVRAMGHGIGRMFFSVPLEILHGPMPKYAGQAEADALRKKAPQLMDETQKLLRQAPVKPQPITTGVLNSVLQGGADQMKGPSEDASSQ